MRQYNNHEPVTRVRNFLDAYIGTLQAETIDELATIERLWLDQLFQYPIKKTQRVFVAAAFDKALERICCD